MVTFVNEGLNALNVRLAELDLLLSEASSHTDSNEKLYKALCRSTQVLLIAHFEGYIKDFVKDVLEDINYFSSFKDSGTKLKFTFCENFVTPKPDGKINEKKVLELIEVFDSLGQKFNKKYFLFDNNKNPKESIIETITKRFGEDGFFKKMNNSVLQNVFSNTDQENKNLRNSIKSELETAVLNYPYNIPTNFLKVDLSKPITERLWEAYLSEALKRRHEIAHGSPDNTISHTTIDNEKIKLEILMYAFTGFICQKCNPNEAVAK
jgi:hypothetical protein